MSQLRELTERLQQQEQQLRGTTIPVTTNHAGQSDQPLRLSVRQRMDALLDPGATRLELGLWAAWQMYAQWGEVPAAGVVTVIGRIHGRPAMVIANDASVKAGAFFPQSVKKVLRAQRIAMRFRLPIVYLVDSAGVFLPLQDEIFPDEDDFGRIFRNNAVISAMGIPQYAAVLGHCVAGGAYLPVLCDKVVMTEHSQMALAGTALVKAAIGQDTDPRSLGGGEMHAKVSGSVDFLEPDDRAALQRLRRLLELLRDDRTRGVIDQNDPAQQARSRAVCPRRPATDVYELVSGDGRREYDMGDLLETIVDQGSLQRSKPDYGPTVVTAFAKIDGIPVGVVANQRRRCRTAEGEWQIGGVLYGDAVSKAARFVLDCNQTGLPLVFLQDVQGFMVGTRAEQSGIIRCGAKLVNAVSNSTVPKLTVIVGGSFGAGNYGMCGKAYDPWLIVAWPSARYAVMGGQQAADTLLQLKVREAERRGAPLSDQQRQQYQQEMMARFEQQSDIRYGAARGWVDALIEPHQTRQWLAEALSLIPPVPTQPIQTGVFQV